MDATIIQEDLTIQGNLVTKDGEVSIGGHVQGDVQAKTVEILVSGNVKGAVDATEVVVSGVLNGSFNCKSLALEENANVEADVTAGTMTMSSGAKVSGHVKAKGG
ncbi:MAG: polymer-forming cytoskeletal protein [Pseudomonadota bacterium]